VGPIACHRKLHMTGLHFSLMALRQEVIEVAAPAGRVLARPVALCLGSVEHLSIRPRRREAVSGTLDQSGCTMDKTCAVVTASTGTVRIDSQ
jgi:hypothetical protein